MISSILSTRNQGSGFLLLLCAALLTAIAPGCGDDSPRIDDTGASVEGKVEGEISVSSPTFNIIYLIRSAGNKVKVTGKVEREGLGEGYVLAVNETIPLEIYEYDDIDDRLDVEKRISPDGMTIAGERVEWAGAPHFFRTDKTIIFYQGDDTDNVAQLATVFGKQFAGR